MRAGSRGGDGGKGRNIRRVERFGPLPAEEEQEHWGAVISMRATGVTPSFGNGSHTHFWEATKNALPHPVCNLASTKGAPSSLTPF